MSETKPQRIQRKRSKGWRMPEGAVNVARPSRWGNPFRAGLQCTTTGTRDVAADEAVAAHREWLEHMMGLDCTVRSSLVADLRGRHLACWCRLDQPCHADTLLELANG